MTDSDYILAFLFEGSEGFLFALIEVASMQTFLQSKDMGSETSFFIIIGRNHPHEETPQTFSFPENQRDRGTMQVSEWKRPSTLQKPSHHMPDKCLDFVLINR